MTTAMTPNSAWPFPTETPKEGVAHKLCYVELARIAGIRLLYHFDREKPTTGGYTIAFRKSTYHKSGKMVDVAVSYCSEGDRFDKKIGREIAIRNLEAGKFIQVPALAYGEDDLHNCLREMFTWHIRCGHTQYV